MTLLPYDLTFRKPLILRRSGQDIKMDSKKGIIIKIERDDITSCSDLSPLPHISIESYEDVLNDCKKINTNGIFKDIDAFLVNENEKNLFLKDKFLDFDFSKYTKLPSLKHALSCLFSDYYRRKLNIKILGHIYYHGLILNKEDGIQKALRYEKLGFEKVKLKIGSAQSLDIENNFIKEILQRTQHIKFRLDANLSFKLSDYSVILKGLDLSRIDYVEEPVAKTTELLSFAQVTQVPIGIDENLHLMKDIRIEGVKAIIIKPTLIGDFHSIKKIIMNSKKRGIYPIISSSFESQVGIYQLAQLASELNPQGHHGLDTFDCYLENLMDLDIQNNAIVLKESLELKGPIYV